jgi:hypothetical protein
MKHSYRGLVIIYTSVVFLFLVLVSCTGPYSANATPESVATPENIATPERIEPQEQPSSPSKTPTSHTVQPVMPPQGLYESCLPSEESCLDRLEKMGKNGFRIVLNDGLRYASNAEELTNYADAAQNLGMQVIMPIKYNSKWDGDPAFLIKEFPQLAHESGCADNKCFLKYYVNVLKDHPALWGYYIADEVHKEYYPGLKEYSEYVKNLDPDHPRLIVEEGTNDPMEVFHTFPSFMKDTADVLGVDYYPYGYRETYSNLTRFTGEAVRKLRYWSDKLGMKPAVVLQAYSQTQYYSTTPLCMPWPFCATFPTKEQMKAQRDQSLLNTNPEIILWFSYPDILKSDQPEQHWKDLVDAAFSPLPTAMVPTRTPRVQICPSGWNCEDIGAPIMEGSQTLNGNTWMVQGAGWKIGSSRMKQADQFRYVWQELAGDGELSARRLEEGNSATAYQSGIMMRQTYDPISPFYSVLMLPGNRIVIKYRSNFGEDPIEMAVVNARLPIYTKIGRKGSEFVAYTSNDGVNWSMVPNSKLDIPSFNGKGMAGLVATSGNENALNSARFDSVQINQ